jgi:uncharacterized protein
MAYRKRTLEEHLRNDGGPKRILALDGGGLRGILSIGMLERLETLLAERHGVAVADFRLSDYFDLICGTSTGAIIAAALALGMPAAEIRGKYFELGEKVFEKSWLRQGFVRAKYDKDALIKELKKVFRDDRTLGSDTLQTGLMIVTKRLDSGSPWPMSNNPRGKYFATRPSGAIGNGDYQLWQVVRASTAAPCYFDPETITIIDKPEPNRVEGEFIDGGMSPFNNPALLALMYATLDGYRIGWPMGADKLLLVSIGTGMVDPRVRKANLPAEHGVKALLALMSDCASLQETLVQWMSSSPTARKIDRELGDLGHDVLGGTPLLSYLRFNVDLTSESVKQLDPALTDKKIAGLSEMDDPENMQILHALGTAAAARDMHADHFPLRFDLCP